MNTFLVGIYIRNNAALLFVIALAVILTILGSLMSYDLVYPLFSLFAIFSFLLVFKKQLYDSLYLLKILISAISHTPSKKPIPVKSDHFTDLEIYLSNDTIAVDVLQKRQIIKSIRKKSVKAQNAKVVCYQIILPYFNPLFMSRFSIDARKVHFGIVLFQQNVFQQILRIENLDLTSDHIYLDMTDFHSVRQLAHNITAHLELEVVEVSILDESML